MSPQKKISTKRRRKGAGQELKILLGIALVAILLIGGAAWMSNRNAAPVEQDTLIRADSPQLGPDDARVTIVEFLDPECESCRAAFPMVKQIMTENENDVRLVVRYFPLHNNSVLAARATEAAGEQGKYWEMQELLFVNQPVWGEQQTPQTELFIQYANELGLDVEAFRTVLASDKYMDKVQRDQQDGQALGVRGTPTFFVNGELISIDELPAMVRRELGQ